MNFNLIIELDLGDLGNHDAEVKGRIDDRIMTLESAIAFLRNENRTETKFPCLHLIDEASALWGHIYEQALKDVESSRVDRADYQYDCWIDDMVDRMTPNSLKGA